VPQSPYLIPAGSIFGRHLSKPVSGNRCLSHRFPLTVGEGTVNAQLHVADVPAVVRALLTPMAPAHAGSLIAGGSAASFALPPPSLPLVARPYVISEEGAARLEIRCFSLKGDVAIRSAWLGLWPIGPVLVNRSRKRR